MNIEGEHKNEGGDSEREKKIEQGKELHKRTLDLMEEGDYERAMDLLHQLIELKKEVESGESKSLDETASMASQERVVGVVDENNNQQREESVEEIEDNGNFENLRAEAQQMMSEVQEEVTKLYEKAQTVDDPDELSGIQDQIRDLTFDLSFDLIDLFSSESNGGNFSLQERVLMKRYDNKLRELRGHISSEIIKKIQDRGGISEGQTLAERVVSLQQQLKRAVEDQSFEKAVLLRDQIKYLQERL